MTPLYLLYIAPWWSWVWHVPFVKNGFVAVGPHHGSLQNLRFKVSVSLSEKSHQETVLVLFLDIGRRNADKPIAWVVLGINKVLDDIYPAHGASVRQICPYPGLDGEVKLLYHSCLFFALTDKMLNTVALHQGVEIRVEEFLALVGL